MAFIDQGEFEAMKTPSSWEATRCDEHPFLAKIKANFMAAIDAMVLPPEKCEDVLKKAKEKVKRLRDWKEREEGATSKFEDELGETIKYCSDVFEVLRFHRQFDGPAEELAEDIVSMRNYLGDKFMPLHKYPDFPRGVVECGSQTLLSAQYFEEVPFYGPPRPCGQEDLEITKFYKWRVVKVLRRNIVPSTPVDCTYYLEKGPPGLLDHIYYVLGMTRPGMHATIQSFHAEKPSFFTIEEMIMSHLSSQQQGGQLEFAAASFHK